MVDVTDAEGEAEAESLVAADWDGGALGVSTVAFAAAERVRTALAVRVWAGEEVTERDRIADTLARSDNDADAVDNGETLKVAVFVELSVPNAVRLEYEKVAAGVKVGLPVSEGLGEALGDVEDDDVAAAERLPDGLRLDDDVAVAERLSDGLRLSVAEAVVVIVAVFVAAALPVAVLDARCETVCGFVAKGLFVSVTAGEEDGVIEVDALSVFGPEFEEECVRGAVCVHVLDAVEEGLNVRVNDAVLNADDVLTAVADGVSDPLPDAVAQSDEFGDAEALSDGELLNEASGKVVNEAEFVADEQAESEGEKEPEEVPDRVRKPRAVDVTLAEEAGLPVAVFVSEGLAKAVVVPVNVPLGVYDSVSAVELAEVNADLEGLKCDVPVVETSAVSEGDDEGDREAKAVTDADGVADTKALGAGD